MCVTSTFDTYFGHSPRSVLDWQILYCARNLKDAARLAIHEGGRASNRWSTRPLDISANEQQKDMSGIEVEILLLDPGCLDPGFQSVWLDQVELSCVARTHRLALYRLIPYFTDLHDGKL